MHYGSEREQIPSPRPDDREFAPARQVRAFDVRIGILRAQLSHRELQAARPGARSNFNSKARAGDEDEDVSEDDSTAPENSEHPENANDGTIRRRS